ncbi:MAG TPA: ketoacyl-ACP synthase III family protein [Stellaceae bacterium]|nr:ketoacyl-ACP synthase III family protein [Stellaceae bacterium]
MVAVIEAIECAFGESERPYSEVVNFDDVLKANNYPNLPGLFGWGNYRKTAGDIFDLGLASAARTMADSAISAKEIDFVYFCSTCFPGDEIEHIKYNAHVISELGASNAFPVGITLNNCASFLSAITMACKMVESGAYNNILVITADKVYDETIRMNNFALLSDAAASCIVTNRPVAGYRVVSDVFRTSDNPIFTNRGKDDSPLYLRVFNEIIEKSSVKPNEIKKVFCSNVFKSITLVKEKKLGFSRDQLFLENIPRYGHCFSADVFINLIEYERQAQVPEGERFMFSVDAPNLRASVLLERVGEPGVRSFRCASDVEKDRAQGAPSS